ncbi:hypothetical protein QTP86_019752, partial [Hemibagrus guttatus]
MPRISRDSVTQYLQYRPDQSVLILHARVAQKSYGNEKRFFCPPPCVYLCGAGWNLRQEHLKASGLGESSCHVWGYMGLDGSPGTQADNFKLSFEEQTERRLPREELWYCKRKSGVAEKYVRVVQDMYERSRTVVTCAVGQTEEFKVEVGLHQGPALSPFLFAMVMDQLSEEVIQKSPWTMMFAGDIVICSESREQVEENLERWRFALEGRGMKVSRSKTEYMCVNEREESGTVRLQGEEVKKVQEFKYLGLTVQSNGECGKEMFACAKTLYISDTDKRKHFRLLLRLFQSGGQEIGSFQSGLIKVISKPSQKRQSMKNADLCIPSGSRVSLFNRLRSQTVSTRYLAVEGGAFVASARQWTAFTVILVEDQHTERSDYSVCESYICYGTAVQLVCTISGVALPPMVIRKVNKQHACLDIDEPVSQLHKCAFQLRNCKHMYLCLSNEKILQYQASPCPKESSRELLNDGSCWTITGTEVVEYTFSESLTIRPTLISPIPIINGLELNGGGHVAMLELHGENFSPYLKVWFGNMEAETMF